MLTAYIQAAMKKAAYRILEDGTYFGEIRAFQGVWSNADSLEGCRSELQEVLEEWLLLQLREDVELPELDGVRLPRKSVVP